MDPVTMSLIAMGVGSGIKVVSDLFDDTGAKQAAMTREAADLKKSALEETMRRAEGQQTQVLSSTKARMGATGFDSSSKSFTDYLSTMGSEFLKQNAFARAQGMGQIDLMEKAADIQGDPLQKYLKAAGDFVGGVGNVAGLAKSGSSGSHAADPFAGIPN